MGLERDRLDAGYGPLEQERTRETLARYLPPSPAVIADIGGGAGVYALWLAGRGYEVHLRDPVPLHIEQAVEAARSVGGVARVGERQRRPCPGSRPEFGGCGVAARSALPPAGGSRSSPGSGDRKSDV